MKKDTNESLVLNIDSYIHTKVLAVMCRLVGSRATSVDIVESLYPRVSAQTKLRVMEEATELFLRSL